MQIKKVEKTKEIKALIENYRSRISKYEELIVNVKSLTSTEVIELPVIQALKEYKKANPKKLRQSIMQALNGKKLKLKAGALLSNGTLYIFKK